MIEGSKITIEEENLSVENGLVNEFDFEVSLFLFCFLINMTCLCLNCFEGEKRFSLKIDVQLN